MGLISFFTSKKNLQSGVIDTSKKYNISYDKSILEDKNKMIDWIYDADKKIKNNEYNLDENCKTSISNTNNNFENKSDINPSSGLSMNGNIDISGNPYGSNF